MLPDVIFAMFKVLWPQPNINVVIPKATCYNATIYSLDIMTVHNGIFWDDYAVLTAVYCQVSILWVSLFLIPLSAVSICGHCHNFQFGHCLCKPLNLSWGLQVFAWFLNDRLGLKMHTFLCQDIGEYFNLCTLHLKATGSVQNYISYEIVQCSLNNLWLLLRYYLKVEFCLLHCQSSSVSSASSGSEHSWLATISYILKLWGSFAFCYHCSAIYLQKITCSFPLSLLPSLCPLSSLRCLSSSCNLDISTVLIWSMNILFVYFFFKTS